MLSHPELSEFHLESVTAPVAALFLNCPLTMRPGHPPSIHYSNGMREIFNLWPLKFSNFWNCIA
jgi:hypothetical protein